MTEVRVGPLDSCAKRTIRAAGVTEAHAFLAGVFGPVHVQADSRRDIDMRVDALRLDTLAAGRLSFGQDVVVHATLPSHYHVIVPLNGDVVTQRDRGGTMVATPYRAAVFTPADDCELTWPAGTQQLCLSIPQGPLELELEQLLGRSLQSRLELAPAMDLTGDPAKQWRDLLDVLIGELDDGGGLILHSMAARHLELLLLDGLLLGHQHNYSEELLRSREAASASLVANAIQLLEERPAEPWSNVTLARELHVSVRSLHDGFQRSTGMGPMTYLRNARLRHVYQDLREATPAEVTVSGVAARWGLLHMGRFAAQYRARFGELPSETLKKV